MNIKKLLLLFSSIFVLFSCTRNEVEKLTTELRIKVNLDGSPRPGAVVSLYRSTTDMETRVRPLAIGTTDGSGTVLFKNLQTIEYFLYVNYNDGESVFDNSKKAYRIFDDLIEGGVTVATVDIEYARPVTPTKMVVKSLNLIRFDTSVFIKEKTLSCSPYLLFTLFGLNFNNVDSIFLGNTKNTVRFCYENKVPAYESVEALFKDEVEVSLDEINTLYLHIATSGEFGEDPEPYIFQEAFIDKSISDITLSDFTWDDPQSFYTAYPNRIRVLEQKVASPPAPRGVDYIIDLRVSWK